MHMTYPDAEMKPNLIEELIRYVTSDFKQRYDFFITGKPTSNKSFRLYMIDKHDFLELPLYKYKNEFQKQHAYQCVLHDFFLVEPMN